jgi:murein L,D-transpeptidase YafK
MSARIHHFVGMLAAFILGGSFLTAPIQAQQKRHNLAEQSTTVATFEAESRLIAIYKMIGAGQARAALPMAAQLTKAFPNFQLGHLVYGDLLNMQIKPSNKVGELATSQNKTANQAALADLREESAQRVKGLQDRPPQGAIPSQILGLATRNKHILAVDASKSRLYVLENTDSGLKLVMDTYISVGKEGVDKYVQGDLKTPLGVYYLTSPVDPKLLAPLYGGGALPINYPNPFDQRLGKSGHGIWLHGTMPERYSRPVKASDGCIVMANPDLQKLMALVAVKTTPVIIASKLQWVKPDQMASERNKFEAALGKWRDAKNNGDTDALYKFYDQDFNAYGKPLAIWWPAVQQELVQAKQKPYQWQQVTTLTWRSEVSKEPRNIMIVTYDEKFPNRNQVLTKRQYWLQIGSQWKIFFEGVIASS